jgi:hypothetical protein
LQYGRPRHLRGQLALILTWGEFWEPDYLGITEKIRQFHKDLSHMIDEELDFVENSLLEDDEANAARLQGMISVDGWWRMVHEEAMQVREQQNQLTADDELHAGEVHDLLTSLVDLQAGSLFNASHEWLKKRRSNPGTLPILRNALHRDDLLSLDELTPLQALQLDREMAFFTDKLRPAERRNRMWILVTMSQTYMDAFLMSLTPGYRFDEEDHCFDMVDEGMNLYCNGIFKDDRTSD